MLYVSQIFEMIWFLCSQLGLLILFVFWFTVRQTSHQISLYFILENLFFAHTITSKKLMSEENHFEFSIFKCVCSVHFELRFKCFDEKWINFSFSFSLAIIIANIPTLQSLKVNSIKWRFSLNHKWFLLWEMHKVNEKKCEKRDDDKLTGRVTKRITLRK